MRVIAEPWMVVVASAILAAPSLASAQAPGANTAPAPGVTAHASPPSPSPSIATLLASARAKRAAADCSGALADYEAAGSPEPSPATIEGLAFCRDKLGHIEDALAGYRRFLADVPPTMMQEGADAKARVEAIEAMPGHLHIETKPSDVLVTVDGVEATTHAPLDLVLAPGKHTLHVTAVGCDPVDRDVEVVPRENTGLALELAVTPPPPPPPTVVIPLPRPPPRSAVPAMVGGGLALVAVGIGTGFGIAALNDKSDFNARPTTATANNGETAGLVSDMSFGLAITLALTSIILFTTRNESSSSTASPGLPISTPPHPDTSTSRSALIFSVSAVVTPRGGGAGALLRF